MTENFTLNGQLDMSQRWELKPESKDTLSYTYIENTRHNKQAIKLHKS